MSRPRRIGDRRWREDRKLLRGGGVRGRHVRGGGREWQQHLACDDVTAGWGKVEYEERRAPSQRREVLAFGFQAPDVGGTKLQRITDRDAARRPRGRALAGREGTHWLTREQRGCCRSQWPRYRPSSAQAPFRMERLMAAVAAAASRTRLSRCELLYGSAWDGRARVPDHAVSRPGAGLEHRNQLPVCSKRAVRSGKGV